MFDFDLGKMVLFGVVALVVVGPRELPAALRAAGRVMARVRRLQTEVRRAADTLMADASLDREFESLNDTMRSNLALNPATAMRGSLPASVASFERGASETEAPEYASPEMRAYLAPPAEEVGATPT
jgi:sec-independent protein translocase protein TatB